MSHAPLGSAPIEPLRHGRLRASSPVATVLKLLGIAVTVVVVSVIATAGIAFANLNSQVQANAVDISGGDGQPAAPPLLGAFPGGFNLLVVGTDNDPNQGDDFGERDATLNDVNILLHVSADHKNAVVVSLPRDLVIQHPECTDPTTGEVYDAMSAQPLNEAFSRGGLACVTATVSNLTGLDIDYAAATSFKGVIEMTNAVGGVPVCLVEPINDTDSGLDLPAGTSTIQGAMALAFLRTRHGVGDGSDLARIASQQQYMSSLVRTIKSSDTLTDFTKLYGLAQAATQNIQLSKSLASPDAMVSLALTLKDVDLANMVFVQYPAGSSSAYPGKVVPLEDLADQLIGKITTDQPFSLGTDATGTGSTVVEPGTDPTAAPQPTEEATPTEQPSAPDVTAAPTDSAATPDVIEGLTGQTAAEQTCANAFSG